ncbi:MAG: transcriptional repressor LexA [Gammaproteobacteria bacterium]|nr:transcriptional repressor LexA [Gammaproteobacteria bacterium]MDH5800958.1 transcriptional repressor LexA [Gammaproteobacteria bacterium]
MKDLTERQVEVLDYIRSMIEINGMPPTVAEIAAALQLSSTNGVRGHLQALERKGAIELYPGTSRGIRVLDEVAERGLPVVGQVAAGSPILAEQHIEEYCQVEADVFHPKADYLLRVHGQSMCNVGILDGDLLAVHRRASARNGQIVVARLENEVTVKRFKQKGRIVYLLAENPDYEPIRVNLAREPFALEGIAVGVIRQL